MVAFCQWVWWLFLFLTKANHTQITPEQEQASQSDGSTIACVDDAESKHDLKTYRQQRKAARRALRKEHYAYMNQVREQAGLPIR